MRSKRREWLNKLGASTLIRVQRWLMRKSPEAVERVGTRLGRLWYRVDGRRRRYALTNLLLAFPEMPFPERAKLARRVFEHFGRSTADFLVSVKRTRDELDASMEVVGLEYLDESLKRGKGVIAVTGHLGNWERASSWMSHHGYKVSVVARDANDPKLNDMVNVLRSGPGTGLISRGQAAKPMIDRLKKNEIVGILPDQNTDEHFLPFFGKPAGTYLGPGVIAARTGSDVIPLYCVWVGPGRYRMVIGPPLEPDPNGTVNGEGIMLSVHGFLERAIRAYPEQWLWFHDRWRAARQRGLL